jgi:hypothetical protein
MFDNCLFRDLVQDKCNECIHTSGNIIDTATSKCILIEGCLESDGTNLCLTCDSLLFFDNSVVPPICRPLPPNCINSTPLSVCLLCAPTYYLWSSVCYAKTPGCLTMDSTNVS